MPSSSARRRASVTQAAASSGTPPRERRKRRVCAYRKRKVSCRFPFQRRADLFGDHGADPPVGFMRNARDVRGKQTVRAPARAVPPGRGSAANTSSMAPPSPPERSASARAVSSTMPPPGGIDQERSGLHGGDALRVEQIACPVVQRHMQTYGVGFGQHGVQRHGGTPYSFQTGASSGTKGSWAMTFMPQAAARRPHRGDAAETEQPQRLAANLPAHHAFARPSSRGRLPRRSDNSRAQA